MRITFDGTLEELVQFAAPFANLYAKQQEDEKLKLINECRALRAGQGGIISAIRHYRTATGAALKDAKDAVEAM